MEKVRLGDVATYINGYTFKPTDWSNNGIPIIRIQDLTGNSYQLNRYSGNFDLKYEVNPGDVLISWSASLGIYVWEGERAVLNQHIFKVVFDKIEVNKNFFIHQTKNILEKAASEAHGATMKHLTKPVFDALPFYLPAITEQERIARELNKVTDLINKRKQQLEKLDELVKARFVELFGDPLDKYLANEYFTNCVEFNPKKSEIKDLQDVEVSFVPMECVGTDGTFSVKETGKVSDYYKGYTYFKDGDVLLAKITPCFENGKVAIAENCKNGIGFGTTEFHVSRPISGVSNSQWIKHLLKNREVHQLATINMTGSAGQKRIQTPFFDRLKIYLPPIEIQNQFAAFVEQTDKSKLEVQKSLAKLELLKKSLMQKYFG